MSLKNELKITGATLDDVKEITSLESQGFPSDEAASEDAFLYRLKNFSDWFLTARLNGRIVGFINGILSDKKLITDSAYLPYSEKNNSGENLLLFGLVVHADYRKNGIAAKLMESIIDKAKENEIKHIALTCRENLIPYYEKFGLKKIGVSESVLGSVIWYDMIIEL